MLLVTNKENSFYFFCELHYVTVLIKDQKKKVRTSENLFNFNLLLGPTVSRALQTNVKKTVLYLI